uniref:Uncharacterized protein n=1 Tax=Peronospora matthiolae TaxID=2874970 RepID=A0AAV1TT46_9STRA
MADDPRPLSKKLLRKQEKTQWLAGCAQSFSIGKWQPQVLTEALEIASKPSERTCRPLSLRPLVPVLVHHMYHMYHSMAGSKPLGEVVACEFPADVLARVLRSGGAIRTRAIQWKRDKLRLSDPKWRLFRPLKRRHEPNVIVQ